MASAGGCLPPEVTLHGKVTPPEDSFAEQKAGWRREGNLGAVLDRTQRRQEKNEDLECLI